MRAPPTTAVLILTTAAFLFAHVPGTVASEPVVLATLSGVITNAETGKPIEGVRVYAWTEEGSAKDEDVTGADGRYTLELAQGRGHLEAHAERHARFYREIQLEPNDNTLDIPLKPHPKQTALVEGTVRGSDGNPIPEARVSLSPRYDEVYAQDDAAVSSGSAGGGSAGSPGGTEPARVAPDYYPGSDYDQWNETRTDKSGAFRMNAYPGAKELRVYAPGYVVHAETLTLAEGESRAFRVTLEKAPAENAVLRGRVHDAQTGEALPGAHVTAHNLEWGRYGWANADENGNFEIKLPPGYTQIRVNYWGGYGDIRPLPAERTVATSADDGASDASEPAAERLIAPAPGYYEGNGRQYYAWVEARALSEGENRLDAALKPKSEPTIPLQGYVVDEETKKGIPGAWVSVHNEDTGEWGNARTDEHGSYRVHVRPGRHVVEANADGHFPRASTVAVSGTSARTPAGGADAGAPVRQDIFLQPGKTREVYWNDCCIAYAEEADVAYAKGGDGDEAAASPAAANQAGAPALSESRGAATSFDQASGPETYRGEPGGLGPYDPEAATAPGATDCDIGAACDRPVFTPGPGMLSGVLAVALAVGLASMRRTSSR